MMLTVIPTSTFQIMEKTKVNSIRAKSTHDRILKMNDKRTRQTYQWSNLLTSNNTSRHEAFLLIER